MFLRDTLVLGRIQAEPCLTGILVFQEEETFDAPEFSFACQKNKKNRA